MMMNNPELYKDNNSQQKRDTIDCLDLYVNKLKWRVNGKIIDIGCGDGGTTVNVLKKYLPPNFSNLTGCDKSKEMIDFTKKHYSDEKTTFIVQDIEDDLHLELKNKYDHLFSFYALHWVHDIKKAFQNIYDLLTNDGTCLLLLLGRIPVYDIFRTLSRNSKWSPYLQDIERFVSPYHDMMQPDKALYEYMTKSGFRDIDVRLDKKIYIFETVEKFKDAMKAINPFVIPKDLYEDFFDDFINMAKDINLVEKDCDNNVFIVKIKYSTLIAYGRK